MAQAEAVNLEFASDPETPTLLSGDLNATPGQTAMALLSPCWSDACGGNAAPTSPADNPVRRIDYVLLRPTHRWRVVETRVIPETVASDHRPVLAVLDLLPPQGGPNQ